MQATPRPKNTGCLRKFVIGCAVSSALAVCALFMIIGLYTLSAPGVRPDAHLYNDIGRWLYDQHGGYYITRDMFDLALSAQPNYAEAYYNRAVLLHSRGRYSEALADYTRAIESRPNDAKAYTMRGSAYYDQRDLQKAIAEYTRAIDIKPDYAFAYLNRGIVYRELGEREKAISDLTKVVELSTQPGERALAEKHLAELQNNR